MTLVAKLDMARYIYNSFSASRLLKMGGFEKYCFIASKTCSHSLV